MKVLIVLSLLVASAYCAQYAVLVAGSNGWYNYRHQSDVCHSYQLLIKNGIPAANIIVMAYDDIAHNLQNPFPGAIYNKPSGTEAGNNVYDGCVIDYKGRDVTASNFLAIITANKTQIKGGNGRYLESGPNDEVFLYYSDHGSVGLIAFPVGAYLYADEQLEAFQAMYDNKMYKQLTYYLEACESGSMFVDLPNTINLYGVSAANPSQSSWAIYCPPDDQIDGKHIGTCLGDEFSVAWMEDTEASNPATYTLQQQFESVKTKTVQSQVMQWGDVSFTNLPIGDFQGNGKSQTQSFLKKVLHTIESHKPSRTSTVGREDARDTKVNYLLRAFRASPQDGAVYTELMREIAATRKFALAVESFADAHRISGVYFGSTNFECYKTLVNTLQEQCGNPNEASQRYFKYLYQYCAMYSNWQVPTFNC